MIRRATEQDVDAVVAIYERTAATMTYLPVVHTHAEHVDWFGARLDDCEGWVWDDGVVRGYMIVGGNELMHLYLDVGWTGRRIGTALLEHAKSLRPEGFTLWTFQLNEGARRFYERHGLDAVEFGDGSGNEEGVPDVRYEWRPRARPGSRAR